MVVGPSETMLTGEEWEQPIISLNKSQNLCVCAYGTEGRSNCVISFVFWNYKMHAAGWIRRGLKCNFRCFNFRVQKFTFKPKVNKAIFDIIRLIKLNYLNKNTI